MEIDILIGCEESGIVTKEFRKRGLNAWSCDLLPTSGDLPQYHIQDDVLKVIEEHPEIKMGIFFPPCTDLAVSGARWFKEKRNDGRQAASIDFFIRLTKTDIPRVAIENPIGIMSTIYRKPDQIIHPWQFGHGETKATCLWLKNLPILLPTQIVQERNHNIHKGCGFGWNTEECKMARSKTFPGIAAAMATQWSEDLTIRP